MFKTEYRFLCLDEKSVAVLFSDSICVMKKHIVLFFALIVPFLYGCGMNVPGVGTCKLEDGTPLTDCSVVFFNENYEYTGKLNADGSFSIGGLKEKDGLPVGKYKVILRYPQPYPDEYPASPIYLSANTSGFEVDVTTNRKQRFDFVMKPNDVDKRKVKRYEVPRQAAP